MRYLQTCFKADVCRYLAKHIHAQITAEAELTPRSSDPVPCQEYYIQLGLSDITSCQTKSCNAKFIGNADFFLCL